jgi:hypothetical protein
MTETINSVTHTAGDPRHHVAEIDANAGTASNDDAAEAHTTRTFTPQRCIVSLETSIPRSASRSATWRQLSVKRW